MYAIFIVQSPRRFSSFSLVDRSDFVCVCAGARARTCMCMGVCQRVMMETNIMTEDKKTGIGVLEELLTSNRLEFLYDKNTVVP